MSEPENRNYVCYEPRIPNFAGVLVELARAHPGWVSARCNDATEEYIFEFVDEDAAEDFVYVVDNDPRLWVPKCMVCGGGGSRTKIPCLGCGYIEAGAVDDDAFDRGLRD